MIRILFKRRPLVYFHSVKSVFFFFQKQKNYWITEHKNHVINWKFEKSGIYFNLAITKKRPLQTNDFNPLPDDKILDLSKLKQFADDNLKCI